LASAELKIEMFGEPLQTSAQVKIGDGFWSVPSEIPIAFVYNGRNYAIMMSTPDDLVDFAVGFSLTERIVDRIEDLRSIEIHQSDRGVEYRIALRPELLERFDARQSRRNMIGRAGCGVCGLDSADLFIQKLPKVESKREHFDPAIMSLAFEAFRDHQALNKVTRSVHGAAWVDWAGSIQILKEDVGRHNALDKLIGAILREKTVDVADGFVLLSSRCSYELIEKTARCGIAVLATISAPTLFAISKAKEAGIRLYCRSESGFELVSTS